MKEQPKIVALNPKFQKALDAFMKNGFWRDLYEDAPNGAKEWLEGEFYYSEIDDEDIDEETERKEHMNLVERMRKKDWEWLIKFDCHHPLQKKYFEKMAAAAKE